MAIACFFAGALFGAAQFLLAVKAFLRPVRSVSGALYMAQLLILSLGLLVVMFLISETALLATAVGLVATSITMALVNSIRR